MRTKLHEIFRKWSSSFIETDTLPIANIQFFRLTAKNKRNSAVSSNNNRNNNTRFIKRSNWPKTVGDYLKFTLLKENIDTMSACNLISRNLNLKGNRISYAGTKDKRAITVQCCTVYRKRTTDFKKMNQSNLSPFIRVGNFEYVKDPIKLGSLSGNQFTIVLRGITASSIELVESACSQLKESGFINYFGLQRFGKGGSSSNEIGISLLKNDYKAAVEKLFTDRPGDREELIVAKKHFQNKDYKTARVFLPSQMISERNVLEHLTNLPMDFAGALNKIDRNMRLICIHAFQSYIFNMAASYRIQQHGLQVIEGDLVLENDADEILVNKYSTEFLEDDMEVIETNTTTSTDTDINTNTNDDNVTNSTSTNTNTTNINTTSNTTSKNDNGAINFNDIIHVVTADDITLNRYSMNQVILPLIGYESKLPTNNVSNYIDELLNKHDITMNTFSKCDITLRSKGSYRKIISSPQNFTWYVNVGSFVYFTFYLLMFFDVYFLIDHYYYYRSWKGYNNINDDIVETEISNFRYNKSKMTSATSASISTTTDSSSSLSNNNADVVDNEEVKLHKALVLQFILPPGTYATMLLRELTKHSTETLYQAHLTAQHAGNNFAGMDMQQQEKKEEGNKRIKLN